MSKRFIAAALYMLVISFMLAAAYSIWARMSSINIPIRWVK